MTNIGQAKADKNRWFYACVILTLLSTFLVIGWYRADKRFAENVQVAYVKLSADGTSFIEYADSDKPVNFYASTVESKLSEFVEKCYSRRRETILTDFGFCNLLMSPDLSAQFRETFQAQKVAADLKACTDCDQVTTRIREITGIDRDKITTRKESYQYTNLVFVTDQYVNKAGRVYKCENKIITVLWQFRPMAEVVNRRDELRYNPLGMEVIRSDPRNDPTPINIDACLKL